MLIYLIDNSSSTPQTVYLCFNSLLANKCQKHSIAYEKVISILCLIIFANNNMEQGTCFSDIISLILWCAYMCLLDKCQI